MAETAVLDELLSQREDLRASRDRLFAAILVIAALHGMAILGITFRQAYAAAGSTRTMLQVLLVSAKLTNTKDNPSADYLSDSTQRGAGTTPDLPATRSPHSTEAPLSAGASDHPEDTAPAANGSTDHPDILTTTASRRKLPRPPFPTLNTTAPLPVFTQHLAMEVSGVEDADTLMLRGHPKPGDRLTPNTRASDVAVYLDAWRRKIEKTGTENYPMAALNREGLSGNPVLEVQILPDGKLGEVILKRSSGHPELDKAALGILHLAAPFDPFPSSLLAEHPALRLSYEWQFRGGQLRPSSQ